VCLEELEETLSLGCDACYAPFCCQFVRELA
jgi:hypothetical protein